MDLPLNLGTPGQKNSRAATNNAPAIYDIKHDPVLPAANQGIMITARVEDPDGSLSVVLNYRFDPATAYTSISMNDNGTGDDPMANDGIFTSKIPGTTTGTMVAFYVQATDGKAVVSRFPSIAPNQQCLVRVGETQPAGSLGTYRLWMTQATATRWTSRNKLNNAPLDVTFVYGNERVIYNMGAMFAGSPYISPGYSTPSGSLCGYTGDFPKDDQFLGSSDFILDWPGRDPTGVAENLSYWIADQLNLPNTHRRFIHLHVNGQNEQTRGSVYEDVQQPGGDMLKEWFPEDSDGKFYKIERWFEFSNTISLIDSPQPRLQNYTTTGGNKKLARYRWNWIGRSVKDSPNDYDDLFALVDAVNATGPEPYTSQTLALADIDEMMGIFAVERIINNFDSWGHQIGKNMYAYKPRSGRWSTFMFDNDWLMNASNQAGYSPASVLFTPCEDPTVARMFNHPPFRRAFFRAIRKAVDGPLKAEKLNPRADAMNAALAANGVTRSAGGALASAGAVKTFLQQRRDYLVSQLTPLAAPFAISSNGGLDYESLTNLTTLTGTAPIEVVTIKVNGNAYPVSWTGVNVWSLNMPLNVTTNRLSLEAVDEAGALISGGTDMIIVVFRGSLESPVGHVVFNEIMYNPVQTGASFVELHNTASTTTFDLSNWRIEGVNFIFPQGTLLPPGGFLVVAKDREVFVSNYGNSIPVVGEFIGLLRNSGESLWLIQPGLTPDQDVVIDHLTYANSEPWPPNANGLGSSLQLLDAAQDNSRVSNWAAAKLMTNTTPSINLIPMSKSWKYNQSGTDLGSNWMNPDYDDSGWVAGSALFFVESSALPAPKTTPLTLGATTYYFRTHFSFDGDPANLLLDLTTVVDDGAVYYLNGHELYRQGMSEGLVTYATLSQQLVDNAALEGSILRDATYLKKGDNVLAVEVHQNNTGSSDIVFGMMLDTAPRVQQLATPGSVNSVAAMLPNFPSLWLNEIEPVNLSGIRDESGQNEPWVELHNNGKTAINLTGWHLTDNPTNLARWNFPTGTTIEAGQFLVIWLDGQSSETTQTSIHANFRPPPQDGMLALVFPSVNGDAVLDYINYSGLPHDRSFGRYPDASENQSQLFHIATPASRNDNSAPALPVFINEWMASNQSIPDPSDNDFDDWIELYNPNNTPIDLTGYALSDNPADIRQRFIIPNGFRIEGHGFMMVWADDESPVNPKELHVPFKLDRGGDHILLFAPNGSLVDSITFGIQTNNISQGRWPDGGLEVRFLSKATPQSSNLGVAGLGNMRLHALLENPTQLVIQWMSEPRRIYRIQYKRDLSEVAWRDLTEITATGLASEISQQISSETRCYYRVLRTTP